MPGVTICSVLVLRARHNNSVLYAIRYLAVIEAQDKIEHVGQLFREGLLVFQVLVGIAVAECDEQTREHFVCKHNN